MNTIQNELKKRLIPPMPLLDALPVTLTVGGETVAVGASPAGMRSVSCGASVRKTVLEKKLPYSLTLRAECTDYLDFPCVEWVFFLTNDGAEPSPAVRDWKLAFAFPGEGTPVFVHGNGETYRNDNYGFEETPLTAPVSVSPSDAGLAALGCSPFAKLRMRDYTVRLGVGWPGVWEMTAAPTDEGVSLTLGQKYFNTVLLPGETMRSPSLTLMVHEGGDVVGINLWRRWYFAHILPHTDGAPLKPLLCVHNWMPEGKPEFTAATTENQTAAIRSYVGHGVRPDVLWLDAGWYACDYDWTRIGTWRCDPERFPNGLGEVGRACEANGMKLLLWFEPERVRRGTEIDAEHPEFLLKNPDDPDGDRLFNYGDPAAWNWMVERVDSLIDEYHVGVYRQDFNMGPGAIWRANETADRLGAVENLHTQGYLAYWDALRTRHPDLIIDSCAGGGRRNDMEALKRAVSLHYTDYGYGDHPVKQRQHRLMFEWFPYFRAHTMAWDREDGSYGNSGRDGSPFGETDEFALHCALTPSMTLMTPYDSPDEKFAAPLRFLPVWRRCAEMMLRQDYIPLTACNADPHDWYAMRFEDPADGTGFLQVIRNTQAEEDTFTLDLQMPEGTHSVTLRDAFTGAMQVLRGDQAACWKVTMPKRSGRIWYVERH